MRQRHLYCRYLGDGIWLKLHLFEMTRFRCVVYLDADYLVLQVKDERHLP